MAVDVLSLARFDLGQFGFCSQIDPRIIHQLGDASDAFVSDHQAQVIGCETRSRCLKKRCWNTRGQHDEKVQRQVLGRFQNIADAFQPENVRVFMGINDYRSSAMRHHSSRKLSRNEHRTLDMKMRIDEAWCQVSTLQIDHRQGVVLPQTDNSRVVHCHVRIINLPAEDINQLGVFEDQFSRPFTARYAEFLLDIAHKWLPRRAHLLSQRLSAVCGKRWPKSKSDRY